jgi:hypothetical protein
MSGTQADMVEEALRTAEEAERNGATLRLLGGVAIRLRAKEGLHPAFVREYADRTGSCPRANLRRRRSFSTL